MTIKRVISICVSALVVGIFIAALVILFSWRPDWSEKVEALANPPIVLTPGGNTSAEPNTTLTLKPDGEAELVEFPIGRIETSKEDECLDWDEHSTFTGSASWTANEKYLITLRTAEGETLIGPYRPARSDVVWYRFGVPLCGSDVLWYWAK